MTAPNPLREFAREKALTFWGGNHSIQEVEAAILDGMRKALETHREVCQWSIGLPTNYECHACGNCDRNKELDKEIQSLQPSEEKGEQEKRP